MRNRICPLHAGVAMPSRLIALVCTILMMVAPASAGASDKIAALAPSALVLVLDEDGNELVAQNADEPFVPASVTKVVTAWLAMEVLGSDYRFETRFYMDADRMLYVRGGGDPFLVSEELALLAPELLAATGKEPFTGHGAGRELLPCRSSHSGRRGHRRSL
jgi:D-alanyl-D-alanine carboxypeptidase/D-alanyl-D-alanine-endopeptidase (penicillin-binding protein 4)